MIEEIRKNTTGKYPNIVYEVNQYLIRKGYKQSKNKQAKQSQTKKQNGNRSGLAVGMVVIAILFLMTIRQGLGGDAPSSDYTDKTVNILLTEDENVSVYLDHIDNGKLYVRYVNNSENDYYVSFKKLEINGDFMLAVFL